MPLTQEELFMQEMELQRRRMEQLKVGIKALGDGVLRMESEQEKLLLKFHEKVNPHG